MTGLQGGFQIEPPGPIPAASKLAPYGGGGGQDREGAIRLTFCATEYGISCISFSVRLRDTLLSRTGGIR